MFGLGWLVDRWKIWREGPGKIEALKSETNRLMDELHSAIRNEKISDTQLNAVSVCLEAATIKLKPVTGKVKGGSK